MSDFGISGTPENGQGAGNEAQNQGFDFERSYNELRPEYTRATQELSQYRDRLSEYEAFMEALSDPETQREALASLGFEMDTGTATPAEDEFADPLEQEVEYLRGVVEELQQGRELEAANREQEQLLDVRDDYIGQALDVIEQQTGSKFNDADEEVLGNLAIAMSDADGIPDVVGAYNALYGEEGVLERQRQQWIDSKIGAFTAPMGSTVPTDKRPQNARERAEFIDQRLQYLDQMQR